ncbi:ATP-binding protein [Actinoalloteichus caeruleus]|uniref:ATP-binding protein n=1 Tax=Actinoalloteichus cyanogriseus TaxID=2893586 RepID=UPI003AAF133C
MRAVDEARRFWRRVVDGPAPQQPQPPTESRELLPSVLASLALRDLTLVELLLQRVEQAEEREENPEQLEFLYQIDHLATRMRRNGENLLVLAGKDSDTPHYGPVPLIDVVRAATSEIASYHRVRTETMPDVQLVGAAANDVSHLLAELLDNAAANSPREAAVVVSSPAGANGELRLQVQDPGIGVPPERLTRLNARLAGTPLLDASVARHMGLYVVSRLAHRHGIRVSLRSRPGEGTTASVVLPDRLVRARPASSPTSSRIVAPASRRPVAEPHPQRPPLPGRTPTAPDRGSVRTAGASPLPTRTPASSTPPRTSGAKPTATSGTEVSGTTSGGLPKRAPRRAPTTEQSPRPATERTSSAQSAKALHDALDGFELGQDAARKETAAAEPTPPATETGAGGESVTATPADPGPAPTTTPEPERSAPARRQSRTPRAARATQSAAPAGDVDLRTSDSPSDLAQDDTALAGEPVNPTTKERDGLT